jgi:hypothetical protein
VSARIIPWPGGVATELGVSEARLQARRAVGDAPRLYALTERQLVTTDADLLAWVQAKEVPVSYKCRAPTTGRRIGGAA